jgi:hypothetical protein
MKTAAVTAISDLFGRMTALYESGYYDILGYNNAESTTTWQGKT